MSDIVAKMIIRVYLVSGKEIVHTYEVPKSDKEFEEFIKDMVDKASILMRDNLGYLYFQNPSISYNANNVEGIEISSIGVAELESFLRKEQSRTGFIKQ